MITNYIVKREEKTKIVIADNAIRNLYEILNEKSHTNYVIFSDTTTYKLFGEEVKKSLEKLDKPVISYVIEPGEKNKTLSSVEKLISFMIKSNCDRKTALIGLGGGVICDMATFAAGIFYRGINCMLIPTTLLAQVDASIGGKGGVNIGEYKNLVGVIKQPNVVIIDPTTLEKLPKVQITSGMAEIIKMAIAFDKKFFSYLANVKTLNMDVLRKSIEICVTLKMKIIEKDPLEKTHVRTAVNFGHSLGHAIEIISGIPHGFAVAIGMVYAMEVSRKITGLSKKDMELAISVLQKYNLPTTISGLTKENIVEHMKKDKKNFGGNARLVLLESIGHLRVVDKIDKKIIEESLHKVLI